MRADNDTVVENSLEAAAHHEAGHAVISWLYALPFDYVTIVPGDGYLGQVVYFAGDGDFMHPSEVRRLSKHAYSSCGGPVAESRFREDLLGCDMNPLEIASLFSPWDIAGLINDQTVKNWDILSHPKLLEVRQIMRRDDIWSAVTALARLLIEQQTVSGDDAARLTRRHIPVKWPNRRQAA